MENIYEENFHPFFMEFCAIQIKYMQSQPLNERETKFMKLMQFMQPIMERYIDNPGMTLDQVNLNKTPSIVTTKEPVKLSYNYDEYDEQLVDKDYMDAVSNYIKKGQLDLDKIIATKPYTIIIN